MRELAEQLSATELGKAQGFDPRNPSLDLLREVQLELGQAIGFQNISPCRIRKALARGPVVGKRPGTRSPGSGPLPRLMDKPKLARVLAALQGYPARTYTAIAAELGMGEANLRRWRLAIERAGLNRAQYVSHGEPENGTDSGGTTPDSTPA